MPKKKSVYAGEFKIEVVEYMQKHGLSSKSTAAHFKINEDRPKRWMRIYLEEGAEALLEERRGRSPKSGTNSGRPRQLGAKVEEDLIAEVQRLRMENEYLKKLNALIRSKGK